MTNPTTPPSSNPEPVTLFTVYNRKLFSALALPDIPNHQYIPQCGDSGAFLYPVPFNEAAFDAETAHRKAVKGETEARDALAKELTDYCTEMGFPLNSPFYALWSRALEATVQLRLLEILKPQILADLHQLPPVTLDEP